LFLTKCFFEYAGNQELTLVDDAMISMQYAKNLSSGYGLTFYPNLEPVEGYSNFLQVILMAIWHIFLPSPTAISLAVSISGATIVFVSGVILLKLLQLIEASSTKELPKNRRTASIFLFACTLFFYPHVYWSLRGMETGLTVLMLLMTFYFAFVFLKSEKNLHLCGFIVFATLSYLSRIDALLIGGIVGVGLLYSRPDLWKKFLTAASIIIFLIAIHTMIRLYYYGDPLPNTFYLKIGGATTFERIAVGLRYFANEIGESPWLLPLIIWSGFAAKHTAKTFVLLISLTSFWGMLVYSLYTGGDYAEGQVFGPNRYLTVGVVFALPLLVYFSFSTTYACNKWLRRSGKAITLVFLFSNLYLFGKFYQQTDVLFTADILRYKVAYYLKDLTTSQAKIAVHGLGQVAYYTDREPIDLLGKVDKVVAKGPSSTTFRPGHNKWNYEYSISERKPDLIADRWGKVGKFIEAKAPQYKRHYFGPSKWPYYVRDDSPNLK
jgi:hypothetical protein